MSEYERLNVIFTIVGVLLVATAVSGARRQPVLSPSRTALAVSVGTLGASFLVQSPMARAVQNEITVNFGQLTGNGTTLIAAYALQVMVLHILYDRPTATALARRRLGVVLCALGGMTGLFLVTPTASGGFTAPEAPTGVLAYYLIYTGYLGVTVINLFLFIRRYSPHASDRWLRISMRLHSWACVTAMIYIAGRIGTLILGHVEVGIDKDSFPYGAFEFIVVAVVPATCVALVLAAVAIRSTSRWLHHRRSLRRLRPLWEAARKARPHAVLPVGGGGGGSRFRLYRRIIEIQDAQFAAAQRVDTTLRRQIDDAIAAGHLPSEDARAVREAAVFAAGLACPGDNRPPAAGTSLPAVHPGDNGDLASVVLRLEQMSAAYTGSPIVRHFAAGSPSERTPH